MNKLTIKKWRHTRNTVTFENTHRNIVSLFVGKLYLLYEVLPRPSGGFVLLLAIKIDMHGPSI